MVHASPLTVRAPADDEYPQLEIEIPVLSIVIWPGIEISTRLGYAAGVKVNSR